MRISKTNQGLKVNAIAGTYVVTLGFDLAQTKCKGLLGFSILHTVYGLVLIAPWLFLMFQGNLWHHIGMEYAYEKDSCVCVVGVRFGCVGGFIYVCFW